MTCLDHYARRNNHSLQQLLLVNIDVAKQERNIYFILFYFSQHCNKIKINAKNIYFISR